jgi:DNA-binding transcriptional MerR regulator
VNKLKIGDFIKLTGSTLKTINYYHKIGLLAEPERSAGGYRLYGTAELNRMRFIKRLKSLGLDLKQIKEISGDLPNPKTSREVFESLRNELLTEIRTREERLAKIDAILNEEDLQLEEDIFDSSSFEMITEILEADQLEKYSQACPEIYEQHRRLYGIVDDFQWDEGHQENFRTLAEYFKTHPEQYQVALDLGARWQEISHLDEDDPRIEAFARESVAMVNTMSPVKELYLTNPGVKQPLQSVFQEMVAGVLTPAQIRYQYFFKKLLFDANQ